MNSPLIILFAFCTITFCGCGGASLRSENWAEFGSSNGQGVSDLSFLSATYLGDTDEERRQTSLREFIVELEKTNLTEVNTVGEIPIVVRTFLDSLKSDFSIASPNEDWQVGCTGAFEIDSTTYKMQIDKTTGDTTFTYTLKPKDVPRRQLAYFGAGNGIALMAYYKGGYGKSENILIFKFDKDKIIDFWCGNMLTDISSKTKIIECL